MIEPTEGRIVHYHPPYPHDRPLAALVVGVHDPRCVNLTVFHHDGSIFPELEVPLLQDDDAAPAGRAYAEWMAFQRGQAAKTEAAASDLHARLQALEKLLETGGEVHKLFENVQQDVANFVQQKFAELEQRLANAPAPQDGQQGSQASQQNPAAEPKPQDVAQQPAAPVPQAEAAAQAAQQQAAT